MPGHDLVTGFVVGIYTATIVIVVSVILAVVVVLTVLRI